MNSSSLALFQLVPLLDITTDLVRESFETATIGHASPSVTRGLFHQLWSFNNQYTTKIYY